MIYWIHLLNWRLGETFPGFWRNVATTAILTALFSLLVRRFPSVVTAAIDRFNRSAKAPAHFIAAAMCLPLAVRLAYLPWIPPPEPKWHDEFAHLLVADTLAAGRLTNPPHPLARHLETQYVLQEPTYSSKYTLGQGMIMAAGQVVTGKPWAGVLLADALMSGAVAWMLFGCLPPAWAAAGGLLGALTYGLADEWIDSYFGGAFCAFGGALVFGAFCRLRQSPSKSMAFLAGLGWSIVWLIRPFESVLTGLFAWGFMAWFAARDRNEWKSWIAPAALMLCSQAAGVALMAAQNHAVTGSYTLLPYQLNQRTYGVPQAFLWQAPIKEPVYRFAEAKDMYWWQRGRKDLLDAHPFLRYVAVLFNTWAFYLTPWLSVPFLLALVRFRANRDIALGAGMIAGATACAALYPFFSSRYIAAYQCVFLYLIVCGLMALSERAQWGRLVAAFLIIGACVTGLAGIGSSFLPPVLRSAIAGQIMAVPGRHVAFVRYSPPHSFHDEWVYNAATVDASRIVWCRYMGPADDAEVAHYYKDRQFWLVDFDSQTAHLSPYSIP